MVLYPEKYVDSVLDITPELLEENNISGIILDVDNTLMDKRKNMPKGVKEWLDNLKEKGYKICIVSNTSKVEKVKSTAEYLGLPYFYLSLKPFKRNLKKAQKLLEIEDSRKIAVIGDQVFTDVWGANRAKMFPILVKPISSEDIWVTVLNRKLEKHVLKRYIKKQKKKEENKEGK